MAELIDLRQPHRNVVAAYEAGHVLVWPDYPLPLMHELAALPVHAHEPARKLKSKNALLSVRDPKQHALSFWSGTREGIEQIQSWMRQTQEHLRRLVRGLFPGYLWGEEMHTWRYTAHADEPLHFDAYADRVNELVVRVFVNVDDDPRTWGVGPDIVPFCRERKLKAPTMHGLVNMANAEIARNTPAFDRICFAPRTLWIVQSQRTSHTVISGKRLLALSFHADAGSAQDPKQTPQALARQV